METIVDYVGKLSGMVKQSLDDTRKFIGKEIIDATAGRKGLCIDRVSDFLGTRISFMGVKYEDEDLKQLEEIDGDVIACQGRKGYFFVPMKDITAVGEQVILLKTEVGHADVGEISGKRENIFKRFYLTKEAIKDVLPGSVPLSDEKEDKRWLKKLIGE